MLDPDLLNRKADLVLDVFRGNLATIAKVRLYKDALPNAHPSSSFWGDDVPEALGESRIRLGDEYDFEIGDNLAIGRALIALGNVLVDTANFRVKVADGEFNRAIDALSHIEDPSPIDLLDHYRGYFDNILKET